MIVVDANILLYAVNEAAPQHERCKSWLIHELASGRPVGLPWVTLVAFVRIATGARVFPMPLTAGQALGIADSWLALPNVTTPEPGPRHFRILSDLLLDAGTAGNLTTDAHLAAMTLELGGKIATLDRNLGRFGVPIVIPDQPA
ncbi:type II toxin-antitoxin system VapC family toxin [Gordonia sp. TBRC 11910]|uniref:Ribonuclease VapC n=1 Tax=Gordonia asplenii TaxID=2725283 RepID=A0A848L259_9ACTN|nr:TA system VapC family ribonuclease toxin [Gordonia asplenii]NMO04876.1 type II toxin-antitoxin system VapC family toxin [Gordonia asplenii]